MEFHDFARPVSGQGQPSQAQPSQAWDGKNEGLKKRPAGYMQNVNFTSEPGQAAITGFGGLLGV